MLELNPDKQTMKWKLVNCLLLLTSIIAGSCGIRTFTGPNEVPGWLSGVALVASFGVVSLYFSIRGIGNSPACSFSKSPFSLRLNPLNFYYIGGILASAHGLAGLITALLVDPGLWRVAMPSFCLGVGCVGAVKRMEKKRGPGRGKQQRDFVHPGQPRRDLVMNNSFRCFLVSLGVLSSLYSGGSAQDANGNAEALTDPLIHKALVGTWIIDRATSGGAVRGTFSFFQNGGFSTQFLLITGSNEQRFAVHGKWEVNRGVLIETITKSSDPKFNGVVTRDQVLRLDSGIFVYKTEKGEVVARKKQQGE